MIAATTGLARAYKLQTGPAKVAWSQALVSTPGSGQVRRDLVLLWTPDGGQQPQKTEDCWSIGRGGQALVQPNNGR